jgi:uncharacterized protein (DUF697 family)
MPLNVSKLAEAWKEVSATTGRPAGVVLAGDSRLVGLAQERLASGGTLPATWVRPLADLTGLASVPGELLILLVPAEQEAEALAAVGDPAPRGGAIIAVDEGPAATGKTTRPCRRCTRLSFSDTPAGWKRLFEVCSEVAGEHVVALGRRYPVLREAAANRVISRTAAQNALVGLAFFIPGSDMPVMILNQVKMVLSIANLFGLQIDRERAVEVAGIVGMGFGLRALARHLARSMPGIGPLIKAAAGYSATMAMGRAAVCYFEQGAPASTSQVVALASTLRR